jgi:Zinc-binding dehydrogenase
MPVVDRAYSLSNVPDAIRYLEQRQVQGKIAITVAQNKRDLLIPE